MLACVFALRSVCRQRAKGDINGRRVSLGLIWSSNSDGAQLSDGSRKPMVQAGGARANGLVRPRRASFKGFLCCKLLRLRLATLDR